MYLNVFKCRNYTLKRLIKIFTHTTPQQSARILRGQSMVEKGFEPTQIDANTFQVQSQSGNGTYTVLHKYNAWICDCPDFTYRHIECKPIHAIRFWQTQVNIGAYQIRRPLKLEGIFPY